MTRARVVIALLLLAGSSSVVSAELKYTVRIQTHAADVTEPTDPRQRELGNVLLEMVAPEGAVEMTCIVGDGTARITWNKALVGLPPGSVLIRNAEGLTMVLSPADRTYWKLTLTDWYGLPPARKPAVTSTPTGETGIVAGVRSERSAVRIRIPFPEATTGHLVLGTPAELPLQGDIWVTNQFARYATPDLRSVIGLATFGFDVAPDAGFVMRQRLRGAMFGGLELESSVTSIAEEDVPDALFEVPAGYKEIPRPRIVG